MKTLLKSLAVTALAAAVLVPAIAEAHPHRVCHFDHHHHRMCRWVRYRNKAPENRRLVSSLHLRATTLVSAWPATAAGIARAAPG
ncbi:hypothetical protein GPU89_26440 [Burkholderia cepacia]|nr:hypothetical protein [Burkholderia cepacia]